MIDYVMESFYDLLAGDFEEISDSDSSRGSHHPLCECFIKEGTHHAKTPEGHVASVHEGEVAPYSTSTMRARKTRGSHFTNKWSS
jgi:hypothetical protein